MQDIISCVLLRVPPSGGTLSVTHSALFRLLWFRLFCFVLLCRVIFCFGGIKPPWGGFVTHKGVVIAPQRGGYNPPKGWFYPPKGVVLSPIKVGIKPPGVVLRVVLSPIWGWFYARDHPLLCLLQHHGGAPVSASGRGYCGIFFLEQEHCTSRPGRASVCGGGGADSSQDAPTVPNTVLGLPHPTHFRRIQIKIPKKCTTKLNEMYLKTPICVLLHCASQLSGWGLPAPPYAY